MLTKEQRDEILRLAAEVIKKPSDTWESFGRLQNFTKYLDSITVPDGWKLGDELAPFHPDASHVEPGYRDGWNDCYRAMLAASPDNIAALLDRLDKAERERDALSAEAANARQLATAVCNALGVAIMHDAPNAIDLLREDAERYRWLTDDHPRHETRSRVYEVASNMTVRGKGATDAAIDAARAAAPSDERREG